jgi:hypothetical protein
MKSEELFCPEVIFYHLFGFFPDAASDSQEIVIP